MAGETEAEEGESEKYSRIGCGGLDWREQPSGRRREGAPHSISAAAARGGVSSLTQLDAWDRVVKERSGGDEAGKTRSMHLDSHNLFS
jgi:hypothetical protein